MNENPQTVAIVVTGAIGAGKTPMAKAVADRFGCPLLTEGNGRNFYTIREEVESRRFPFAVFEHCSLLGIWEQFAKEYEYVVWVVLQVNEDLVGSQNMSKYAPSDDGEY